MSEFSILRVELQMVSGAIFSQTRNIRMNTSNKCLVFAFGKSAYYKISKQKCVQGSNEMQKSKTFLKRMIYNWSVEYDEAWNSTKSQSVVSSVVAVHYRFDVDLNFWLIFNKSLIW